jgi:hypothetical protein
MISRRQRQRRTLQSSFLKTNVLEKFQNFTTAHTAVASLMLLIGISNLISVFSIDFHL